MKDVKIIGDDIYFKDVIVAKLINNGNYTLQGNFLKQLDDEQEIDIDLACDNINLIELFLNELKTCSKKNSRLIIIKNIFEHLNYLKNDINY